MYSLKTLHSEMLKLCKTFSTSLKRSMVLLIISGLSMIFIGNAVSSEYKSIPEYLIKAGYLYKFFFFVQWPDDKQSLMEPDNKIIIGILGDNPFGDHFKQIEGQIIKSMNKKITIKRFGPYKDGIKLKQCRVLFICSSEKDNFKKILSSINGTSILTVADIKGFLESGGMVNLVIIKGKIRWELNMTAIEQSGLKINSSLIQSAVRVISAP